MSKSLIMGSASQMISSLKNNANFRRGTHYFKNDIFRKASFNKDLQKSDVRILKKQDKLPLFLSDKKWSVRFVVRFAIIISTIIFSTFYLAYIVLF